MRHRARSLHVLVLAPVAAIVAGVLGLAPHAVAAAGRAPTPIVVTVDPAHGGQPTPAHPHTPIDSGAIGVDGLLEKDVDLDVATRLAALLRADLVRVVMTRTADMYVPATRREHLSVAHHALLVVSIHASTSTNHRVDGSLVRAATPASAAFAQTLSDALSAQISGDGVPDRGVAYGDSVWVHNPVPAATVEMAYLSNPAEAVLMTTAAFRQDVAIGIRDGVEAYMPGIIARRNAIIAWQRTHPGAGATGSLEPASAAIPGTNGFQFAPVIAWLIAISLVGVLLLFRDAVARVLVVIIALVAHMVRGIGSLQRAAIRRRRRRRRSDAFAAPATSPAPPSRRPGSVYDDIPL